ncbi:MAG: hypothetical protein JWQ49_3622 [Edaphobacter sp.]|nr:hypothetical protein [Edaphobacter sp.]
MVGLFRLGGRAEVGLDGLVAGEGLGGFLIGDGSGDDDVVALLPVGGGGDLVFRGELHGNTARGVNRSERGQSGRP